MRAPRSRLFAFLTSGALAVLLAACPAPKSPVGPPPEYEAPPAPSWLVEAGADGADGGGASADDSVEAGVAEPPPALPPPG